MQIIFYQLVTSSVEKTLPRLLEKIYKQNIKIKLLLKTPQDLITFDSILWTYASLEFLGHMHQAKHHDFIQSNNITDEMSMYKYYPIWLSLEDDNPIEAKVLMSNYFIKNTNNQFEKIIFFYNGNNADQVENFKNTYDFYKQQNLEIIHWQQQLDNSWLKQDNA